MSSSTDKAHGFLEVKDYHIFIIDVKLKHFQIYHSILYWCCKYLNQNPLFNAFTEIKYLLVSVCLIETPIVIKNFVNF